MVDPASLEQLNLWLLEKALRQVVSKTGWNQSGAPASRGALIDRVGCMPNGATLSYGGGRLHVGALSEQ